MGAVQLSDAVILLGHRALLALYLAVPVLGAVVALWPGRGRPLRVVRYFAAAAIGLGLSVGLCLVFAFLGDARVRPGQLLLGGYVATSLILILRGLDRTVAVLTAAAFAALADGKARGVGRAAVLLARGTVLIALGLPWVMAAGMVYRPKVTPRLEPSALGPAWAAARTVEFRATDGGRVTGWYVPPRRPDARVVIVAHGLGANRGNQLLLARQIVNAGMGILAIDLRAHGDSGGQLTTFGITERHDVLGAVRWLREGRSTAIAAVGASLGGAAVLAAAADPSPEGHAIEAVAVLGTYTDLGVLMDRIIRDQFPGPLGGLLRAVGFPLAELHAGVRLGGFRPVDAAARLWPRPLLVVHGTRDEVIPIDQGRRLFADAALPKRALWIDGGTHTSIVLDDGVAAELSRFFATADADPIVRQ